MEHGFPGRWVLFPTEVAIGKVYRFSVTREVLVKGYFPISRQG
jgi:hypothetical protein